MTKPGSELEQAGREARRQGKPLDDNPYPTGSEQALAWERGWLDQDLTCNCAD